MAQSYANGGGSGHRIIGMEITLTGSFHLGGFNGSSREYELIDGATPTPSNTWFNGGSGYEIEFDFREARIIDEAKWYQSDSSTHGTWKWQGWDGGAWVDIGSTFTLGGSTVQTITTLNGNVTAYTKYKLLQTAGSASSNPYLHEIEFKIDVPPALSYFNAQGYSDRTASISASTTASLGGGTINNLVDGNIFEASADSIFFTGGQSGVEMVLDFGVGACKQITEMRLFWSGTTAQGGAWTIRGSDDNASWNNIVTGLTLGGALQQIIDLTSNAFGYRYYSFLQVGGTTTNNDFLKEMAFQIGTGTPFSGGGGGGGGRRRFGVFQ